MGRTVLRPVCKCFAERCSIVSQWEPYCSMRPEVGNAQLSEKSQLGGLVWWMEGLPASTAEPKSAVNGLYCPPLVFAECPSWTSSLGRACKHCQYFLVIPWLAWWSRHSEACTSFAGWSFKVPGRINCCFLHTLGKSKRRCECPVSWTKKRHPAVKDVYIKEMGLHIFWKSCKWWRIALPCCKWIFWWSSSVLQIQMFILKDSCLKANCTPNFFVEICSKLVVYTRKSTVQKF